MTDVEKITLYREAFHFYFSLLFAHCNASAEGGTTFCDEYCICSDKCDSHFPNVWVCEKKILPTIKEIRES